MRQTSSRRCRHQPLGTNVNQVEWYRKERGHTLVRLALLTQLARRLDGRLTAMLAKVLIRHDLTAHELVLEVGVDDTGSLRRLRAFADGPGAHFLRTARKVADELDDNQSRARIDISQD